MQHRKRWIAIVVAIAAFIGFGTFSPLKSQTGTLTLQPQSGIIEVSTDGGSTFTQVGDPVTLQQGDVVRWGADAVGSIVGPSELTIPIFGTQSGMR
jgi:hypothetical protein